MEGYGVKREGEKLSVTGERERVGKGSYVGDRGKEGGEGKVFFLLERRGRKREGGDEGGGGIFCMGKGKKKRRSGRQFI